MKKDLEVEFLLCGGIVSFACPECGQNIKATTDEVQSKDTPFVCPHCSEAIEMDDEVFAL